MNEVVGNWLRDAFLATDSYSPTLMARQKRVNGVRKFGGCVPHFIEHRSDEVFNTTVHVFAAVVVLGQLLQGTQHTLSSPIETGEHPEQTVARDVHPQMLGRGVLQIVGLVEYGSRCSAVTTWVKMTSFVSKTTTAAKAPARDPDN